MKNSIRDADVRHVQLNSVKFFQKYCCEFYEDFPVDDKRSMVWPVLFSLYLDFKKRRQIMFEDFRAIILKKMPGISNHNLKACFEHLSKIEVLKVDGGKFDFKDDNLVMKTTIEMSKEFYHKFEQHNIKAC